MHASRWEMAWWTKLNFLGLLPKVVSTNEIVIITQHFPYNSIIWGFRKMFWRLLGYTVAKAYASPRTLTWFTRPFLLVRGWGLGRGSGDETNATKGGVPWYVSEYDITLISGVGEIGWFQVFKLKFPLNFGILIVLHKIRFLDFKVDHFLDSWISADTSYEIYPLICYTPLRLNLTRPPHIWKFLME